MTTTTDTGKEPTAYGARRGTGTVHQVDEDGLTLCGVVLSRQNERTSKEEHSKYWVQRRHNRGVEKPQPEDRKPWYKWDSKDEIPEDHNHCGMCQRIAGGTDGETRKQIVEDIRELTGLERDAASFNKDELRQLRDLLD